ncbi:MAG: metallophosphoesterase [Saprospiraceae bacterium]
MRIAVFADIHGKILLPFKLVDLYQRQFDKSIDLILQCGDIGAFPNLNNLDKATIRHAKNNRDELGFHDDFIVENTEIKPFLDKLNIDMICVRGNHEDHEYLNDLESQYSDESRFPIDIYNRVFVCKTGWKQAFSTDTQTLTFVGIGRIGDRKGRNHQQFIQPYEQAKLQKLLTTKDDFDLLITHDKDSSSERGYGSHEIRQVLDNIIFQYHFMDILANHLTQNLTKMDLQPIVK